jgi:hypothetical protein
MRPALLALPLALALLLAASAGRANDYPTETVADYVLACMAVNGNTRESLRQCSCSIDVLASLLRETARGQAVQTGTNSQGTALCQRWKPNATRASTPPRRRARPSAGRGRPPATPRG